MMISQLLGLPEGDKFVSEDHKVINLYLIKQVRGQPLGLPHDAMKDHKSVYGSSDEKPLPPWKYCNDGMALLDYEKHYFFTMLNRVGEDRVAHAVGNYGAWHVSNTKDIYDPKTQKLIGVKKLLNFKVYEEDGRMSKSEWILLEFSLARDSLEGADPELRSKLVRPLRHSE